MKTKSICALAFLLMFVFCMEGFASKTKKSSKSRRTFRQEKNETVLVTSSDSLSLAENLINYSKQYLGSRYRRGSKGPDGFDCSGFTHFVFSKFNYRLGASSQIQATEGYSLRKSEVQAGDLIFFKGRNSKSDRVGHVGIVISGEENGDIKFIHSACSSGVCISSLDEPYYSSRYMGCNRILREGEAYRKPVDSPYLYPSFPPQSPKLKPQLSLKKKSVNSRVSPYRRNP